MGPTCPTFHPVKSLDSFGQSELRLCISHAWGPPRWAGCFAGAASRSKCILHWRLVSYSTHIFFDHQSETQSRLVIVCPPNCRTYLLDLSWHQDLGLSTVDFVDPNELLRAKSPEDEALQKLCDRYKLKNISTTLVDHRARCFGLQVTSLSGWKVVYAYSGPVQ